MDVKKTKKGTKKFTDKEKLAIIEECKLNGQKLNLAKYGIHASTFSLLEKEIYGVCRSWS